MNLSWSAAMLRVCTAAGIVNSTAKAQACAESSSPLALWRVGPFIGIAHDSPISSQLGGLPGRDHLFLGMQARTQVLRVGFVRMSYAVQILPAVLIRGPSQSAYDGGPTNESPNVAYAVGVSPFGFDLSLPLTRVVAVSGAAAAGGLVFTRPYPVTDAGRISFTLEYGGGVSLQVGRERWLELGYKYHHLSNGYIARENPGLNANVFYGGYQWSVRLPR